MSVRNWGDVIFSFNLDMRMIFDGTGSKLLTSAETKLMKQDTHGIVMVNHLHGSGLRGEIH